VKANGWIEGLTILSIILGVCSAASSSADISRHLLAFDLPMLDTSITTAPEAAISVIVFFYLIAALFNLRIPRTQAPLQPLARGVRLLVRDFSNCNARLWNDKLGQITLATTTLFWGVLGNLRVIVFAWAAAALGYSTTQASTLVGVIAIGTAAGAVWASMRVTLDKATRVIPLGIAMGVLVIGLNFITNVWVAAPFLIFLGVIGGYLVVPMNALLQHRGANLMGAGRSIAVQNFNEQACILGPRRLLHRHDALRPRRLHGDRHLRHRHRLGDVVDPSLARQELRELHRRDQPPARDRTQRQALKVGKPCATRQRRLDTAFDARLFEGDRPRRAAAAACAPAQAAIRNGVGMPRPVPDRVSIATEVRTRPPIKPVGKAAGCRDQPTRRSIPPRRLHLELLNDACLDPCHQPTRTPSPWRRCS
jgi:hypothetical protein